MKFPIKDFLQIWSQLLKKSLMENFNFCTVTTLNKLSFKNFQIINFLLNRFRLTSVFIPSENFWFSDVFRRSKKERLTWNKIITISYYKVTGYTSTQFGRYENTKDKDINIKKGLQSTQVHEISKLAKVCM